MQKMLFQTKLRQQSKFNIIDQEKSTNTIQNNQINMAILTATSIYFKPHGQIGTKYHLITILSYQQPPSHY